MLLSGNLPSSSSHANYEEKDALLDGLFLLQVNNNWHGNLPSTSNANELMRELVAALRRQRNASESARLLLFNLRILNVITDTAAVLMPTRRRTDLAAATAACHSRTEKMRNTSHLLQLTIMLFTIFFIAGAVAQPSIARCYAFGKGKTIAGADYRRDYGVTKKHCAEACKLDACCMAFEWREVTAVCTLKTRSLNGPVAQAPHPDTYFGLCLDYDDVERSKLWDHELNGTIVHTAENVQRDRCVELCSMTGPPSMIRRARRKPFLSLPESHELDEDIVTADVLPTLGSLEDSVPTSHEVAKRSAKLAKAIAYSWKTTNPEDMDEALGTCDCIAVLHGVRLSFGSFASFMI